MANELKNLLHTMGHTCVCVTNVCGCVPSQKQWSAHGRPARRCCSYTLVIDLVITHTELNQNVRRCRDGMPKVCKQGRDDA